MTDLEAEQRVLYLEGLRGKTYTISEFCKEVGLNNDKSGDQVMQEVINIGITSSSRFRERAQWLAASKQCTGWLKHGSSTVLLVNGNDEVNRVSPVSFLAVLTTEKLRNSSNKMMVLNFFCGAYEDYIKGQRRGVSVVESMVLEMLQQFLSRCDVDDIMDQFGYSKLRCLTEEAAQQVRTGLLQGCLELLSNLLEIFMDHFDAMFILIDGVEFMED